jgi:hypothetical protein
MHSILRSACLLIALMASFSLAEKSINMTKEAHSTTMSFLEITADLQPTNATTHQAFEIVVDISSACRASTNQEFTPCPRPDNERIYEQHGLGVPVHAAHDPFGARPLGTVDLGGELEYWASYIKLSRNVSRTIRVEAINTSNTPAAVLTPSTQAHAHGISSSGMVSRL